MTRFEFKEGRGGMTRAFPIKEAGTSVDEDGLVVWDEKMSLEPTPLAVRLNKTSKGRAVQAFITRLDQRLVTVDFDWIDAQELLEDLARTGSYNAEELTAVWMMIRQAGTK